MATTSAIGKSYPAPSSWANHQRVTDMLAASIKLEQAKETLEAMRAALRKQEALVEQLRNREYDFRILK